MLGALVSSQQRVKHSKPSGIVHQGGTRSQQLHFFACLQLQKHDRDDEDAPSRWRSEEEMAAEASLLRKQL